MSFQIFLRRLPTVAPSCSFFCLIPYLRFCSLKPITHGNEVTDLQIFYKKFPAAESFLTTCKAFQLNQRNLIQTIENAPEITHYQLHTISNNIEELVELGFEPIQISMIICKYPYILNYKRFEIITTFETWRSCALHEKFLRDLFVKEPWLFSVSNEEVEKRVKRIHYFMVSKINRVTRILSNCPDLLVADWDEVEEKFEFALKTMRYTEKDISKSTLLVRPMEYIKLRHKFIERVGVYVRPRLNDDDFDPRANPTLASIVDPNDETFATNTAKVSFEEFLVFKKLMELKQDWENDEENLDVVIEN